MTNLSSCRRGLESVWALQCPLVASLAQIGIGVLAGLAGRLRQRGLMRLFRTLLMCLLVLAVPAQGSAAVTTAFCGPDHHGAGHAFGFWQGLHPEHSTEHEADGKLGEHTEHHHARGGHDETVAASDHATPHTNL